MRIVLAADGSKYTEKALAFIANQASILGQGGELVVVNVQPSIPPRVRSMVGADAVSTYHQEEAEEVLKPIRAFLDGKGIAYRCEWHAGEPAEQVIAVARKEGADLIVMGTHGYGVLGRAVMGSIAQRVLHDSPVPVLLVK
jgi:nucleotide-binding universal stress UspA family protein